jgi:hypothetical protein
LIANNLKNKKRVKKLEEDIDDLQDEINDDDFV